MQILLYAGGIMVLYLFSIMLMNVEVAVRDAAVAPPGRRGVRGGRFAGSGDMGRAEGCGVAGGKRQWEWSLGATPGNVEALGAVLYTKFLFPFEVASILLLAAMIGAIVLAKRTIER